MAKPGLQRRQSATSLPLSTTNNDQDQAMDPYAKPAQSKRPIFLTFFLTVIVLSFFYTTFVKATEYPAITKVHLPLSKPRIQADAERDVDRLWLCCAERLCLAPLFSSKKIGMPPSSLLVT